MGGANKDDGPLTSIKKFVQMSTEWTKESLLMATYWVKLLIALILGSAFGLLGVKGFPGNISFVVIDGFLVSFYANHYLGAGYFFEGAQFPLLLEHTQVAYPLFVLTWTVSNTLIVANQ